MTSPLHALPDPGDDDGLDPLQEAVLDFEAGWRGSHALREQEVRERFGISLPRYHQVLNQLLDHPGAMRRQPLLVKRLRRVRDRRQQARSAARLPR